LAATTKKLGRAPLELGRAPLELISMAANGLRMDR